MAILLVEDFMFKEGNNLAYIDGQNLYMGTAKREVDPWTVDLVRFRVYLEKKYKVVKAYYFLGYVHKANEKLYKNRIARDGS